MNPFPQARGDASDATASGNHGNGLAPIKGAVFARRYPAGRITITVDKQRDYLLFLQPTAAAAAR